MHLPRGVFEYLNKRFGCFPFGADEYGIWLYYRGDQVCWTWPWARKGEPKYISLLFSGTGEFGDARYSSLRELREAWEEYDSHFIRKEEATCPTSTTS